MCITGDDTVVEETVTDGDGEVFVLDDGVDVTEVDVEEVADETGTIDVDVGSDAVSIGDVVEVLALDDGIGDVTEIEVEEVTDEMGAINVGNSAVSIDFGL